MVGHERPGGCGGAAVLGGAQRPLQDTFGLVRPPVGAVPGRAQQLQLGLELVAEPCLGREEELELQQVTKAQRLLPAQVQVVLAVGERGHVQHDQLDDCPVEEVVQRAVAIEGRGVVTTGPDRPDRRRAVVEDLHDPGVLQPTERAAQPDGMAQVVLGTLDAAHVEVVQQRGHPMPDLLHGQGAVAFAEQGQADQRRGSGRGHVVDAGGDLEGHLLQLRRALAGVRQGIPQGHRLAEPHQHVAEVVLLGLHVPGEPGQPLGLLGATLFLLRHRGDLVQLLVDQRHGDDDRVGLVVEVEAVDEVPQDPVAGAAQLAGAGAAALHEPLEVELLGHQVAEVATDGELVDLVAAEGPADEDDAGPLAEGAERPEGEVRAAEGVVAGEVVLQQDVGDDQRVDVAAM